MTLLDSNILLRLANPFDPSQPVADAAVKSLMRNDEVLIFLPQNAYEFWVSASRPWVNNGLGCSTSECSKWLDSFKMDFQFWYDLPGIFDSWERLVKTYQCKGKVAHDARLVAAMEIHAIAQILTFNVADFTRYPGISVLDPHSFLPSP